MGQRHQNKLKLVLEQQYVGVDVGSNLTLPTKGGSIVANEEQSQRVASKTTQTESEDNSKYKTEYQQPPANTPVSLSSLFMSAVIPYMFLAYFLHIF